MTSSSETILETGRKKQEEKSNTKTRKVCCEGVSFFPPQKVKIEAMKTEAMREKVKRNGKCRSRKCE